MNKKIELHYFGNLEASHDELVEAFNKALPPDEQIPGIGMIKIRGLNSRFGHLLPERGGDSDLGFREAIELILAFGTVQAFLVFAKAFLSKSGEMLAERLFKPMSKPEQEKALAEEKLKRRHWQDMADKWMNDLREFKDWTEEEKQQEYERWRIWGEAGEEIDYNAHFSLEIYVEEKDEHQHVIFDLNSEDVEFSDERPFIHSPESRFRETIALNIIRLQKKLEEKDEGDYQSDIEKRRKLRAEVRNMLREYRRRPRF